MESIRTLWLLRPEVGSAARQRVVAPVQPLARGITTIVVYDTSLWLVLEALEQRRRVCPGDTNYKNLSALHVILTDGFAVRQVRGALEEHGVREDGSGMDSIVFRYLSPSFSGDRDMPTLPAEYTEHVKVDFVSSGHDEEPGIPLPDSVCLHTMHGLWPSWLDSRLGILCI